VTRLHASRRTQEGGFTLVELLIVVVVMPLVAGAIAIAMLSVLTEQNSVASRTSNSGDTSVLSATFVKDVQSAQQLTTNPSPSTPPACGTTSPLLSLQWPLSSTTAVVSYAVQPRGSGTSLLRYYCTDSSGSNTLVSTIVVAHSVQTSPPLTAAVTGATCTQWGCTAGGEPAAAAGGWTSAVGVSGVTFNVLAPEATASGTTNYAYTLTGVPRVSNNASRGATPPGHAPFLILGTASPAVSCVGKDSISVTGAAAMNSTGTDIQTNGNASFSASSAYVGNPSGSGAFSGSNISPATPTQTGITTTDPYAGMPTPVVEPVPGTVTAGSTYDGLSVFSDSNLQADGPGIYLNAVSVNTAMTIRSGTYVFQNGLSLAGNGGLTGSGGNPVSVLFYIYRGAVSVNGSGTVTLTPLASTTAGNAGITMWMDQGDTSSLSMGGNGATTVISGTVYAPTAQAGVGGNGTLVLGSLVAASVSCNGGGNAGAIRINYGGT
jgi:hypothetical protein